MALVYDNSSIECMDADISSRKIVRSSFMQIKNIGKCMVYKCSRNSEATVTVELNPKKAKHNANSSLDKDSTVKGENILVAINCMKSLKIYLTNKTGTHKAQNFSTGHYTYAQITKQIPSTPRLIPPLEIIPPPDEDEEKKQIE